MPKLRGVQTVYVCQDNEISQAGLKGALRTARVLSEHGSTRLGHAPPGRDAGDAREVRERFGLDAAVGPKDLRKLLEGRTPEDCARPSGCTRRPRSMSTTTLPPVHAREDFERLMAEARSPMEFGIANLPRNPAEEDRNRLLEPLLEEIAGLSPLEQNRLLKLIQERLGKSALAGHARGKLKAVRAAEQIAGQQGKAQGQAPLGRHARFLPRPHRGGADRDRARKRHGRLRPGRRGRL